MESLKTRDEVISLLVARGVAVDMATIYADVWLEYQVSSANIEKNGIIVSHPRTGAPIENPYLVIRERAQKKLSKMRYVDAKGLW